MQPTHYLLKPEGAGGLGGVAYKDRARPPRPPRGAGSSSASPTPLNSAILYNAPGWMFQEELFDWKQFLIGKEEILIGKEWFLIGKIF